MLICSKKVWLWFTLAASKNTRKASSLKVHLFMQLYKAHQKEKWSMTMKCHYWELFRFIRKPSWGVHVGEWNVQLTWRFCRPSWKKQPFDCNLINLDATVTMYACACGSYVTKSKTPQNKAIEKGKKKLPPYILGIFWGVCSINYIKSWPWLRIVLRKL